MLYNTVIVVPRGNYDEKISTIKRCWTTSTGVACVYNIHTLDLKLCWRSCGSTLWGHQTDCEASRSLRANEPGRAAPKLLRVHWVPKLPQHIVASREHDSRIKRVEESPINQDNIRTCAPDGPAVWRMAMWPLPPQSLRDEITFESSVIKEAAGLGPFVLQTPMPDLLPLTLRQKLLRSYVLCLYTPRGSSAFVLRVPV